MLEPIRFTNLPPLLNDMKRKGWTIDSFLFTYNQVNCVVLLTIYQSEVEKPSKYSVVEIEFLKVNDISKKIKAYANFYELNFFSATDFYRFFNIDRSRASISGRQIFIDFSKYFAQFIPVEKTVEKDNLVEKKVISSKLDIINPNARYCYNVRRSGKRSDGKYKERTIENSNKAELERPTLYERYKKDKTLSFYFSDNSEDERTDEEIIMFIAKRN